MTALIKDIVETHPSFNHIVLNKILVAISPSNGSRNGIVAKLRPMRFEGGSRTRVFQGFQYKAPEINFGKNSILYIVYFHLPRFLNHGNFENRLATVLHELYHISPSFNGDVRRFSGRNYAHGSSRKKYDESINIYTNEYLNKTLHPELSAFLRYKYTELKRRYGAIHGDMIRIPRSKPAYMPRRYPWSYRSVYPLRP